MRGREGLCIITYIGLSDSGSRLRDNCWPLSRFLGHDNIPEGMGEEERPNQPLPTEALPATAAAHVAVRNQACVV